MRATHSTRPFLNLQLRTTVDCRSFRFCTFCRRHRPSRQVRAVHSTPPFLYLQLRTTIACRRLRFCTFCFIQALTIPFGACCAQYSLVFVPATPNDGILPQPSVLHFLLLTLAIPSWACCAQYSAVFVPAAPNDGCLPQPLVLHMLLLTLTISSGACCAQYSTDFIPAAPNDGFLPHFSFCTLCCGRRPFRPGRAAHSTRPFLYLQLRTTAACRSLWFCTSCS